jgi:hypothetical protein
MTKSKQIVWTVAKWSAIAVGALFVYYWFGGQDKIDQQFITLACVVGYSTYVVFKKIDETNKSNKYICVFKMDIYSAKSEYDLPEVRLKQKAPNIALPFPPFIGLSVYDVISPIDPSDLERDHHFGEFLSGKIEEVHWNNLAKSFECKVTPHRMSEEKYLGAAIAIHEQYGWRIDGYDPKAEKALEEWKAQKKPRNNNPSNAMSLQASDKAHCENSISLRRGATLSAVALAKEDRAVPDLRPPLGA